MKIAMLAARSSIHTIRWVNALAERGYEIHLVSAHRGGEELDGRVSSHVLPFRAPAGYVLNLPWLQKILKATRPDILHAHYASGYGTLGRLSGFQPFVLSVWGSDVYDFPFRSPVHRRLIASNLEAASWVCATSAAMERQTRNLQERIEAMSVVPFGIRSDVFCAPEEVPPSPFITVGTVKALAPVYGVDILIRAFAAARESLAASDPESAARLRLLLVGGGPQRDDLVALASDLGLETTVEFVGTVRHGTVPEYLRRLDVYAAPSRSESFGVAVLEASACARPVVVSDVGGLPEVVVDGITGLVIPRESVSATADALLKLITDPSLRCRMGEAGRQHALKNYEWSDSVAQMESIYRRVVKSHATGSAAAPLC